MDQRLFFEVIVPLMGVSGTSVVAISTPDGDEDNYYNQLMDIEDPDTKESMFKTIRVGLACAECVAAGIALDCTHRAALVPPWKDAARQRKMRAIMAGQDSLFMRENMGMRTSDNNYVFPASGVTVLSAALPTKWLRNPDVLFCSIDPSGGGSQSEYALCTVACVGGGGFSIVALDSTDSAQAQEVTLTIYEHLMRIRRSDRYRNATIVIYIEANMSWIEVDRVAQICSSPQLGPVIIESSDTSSRNRLGVTTTEANKAAYVSGLMHILQDGKIQYASPLLSKDPDRAKRLLESQLRQFRRTVKTPRDTTFQQGRVSYTGKSARTQDDLAMVLMMAIYWGYLTRAKPEFIERMTVNGWVMA